PIGVTRPRVALEGPEIDYLVNGRGISLDNLAARIARDVDLIADDADGEPRYGAAHLCCGELGAAHRNQLGRESPASPRPLVDCSRKAREHVARKEGLESLLVALRERLDDHRECGARAFQKARQRKLGIGQTDLRKT